jgi:hypothetical protein
METLKNTKFLKGLLMTLVGVIVAAFNTSPIVWSVVAITLLGTGLVYFGKNAWFKSQSVEGTLQWQDILSALLIAVGTSITSAVASIAGSGVVDWTLLWHTVIGVVSTYLGSTLFTGTPINKQ